MEDFMTCVAMSRSGHTFVVQNVQSWFPGIQHRDQENIIPSKARKGVLEPFNKEFKVSLIVVRNYLNWLASYLKFLERKNISPIEITTRRVEQYRKILDEYLFPKYLVKSVGVYYDEFVESKVYRESICYLLGGKYCEKRLETVPKKGSYSSFDGDKYKESGSLMKVNHRYLENTSPYYSHFINNDLGIIDLWREHIGFTGDQEEFLKKVRKNGQD